MQCVEFERDLNECLDQRLDPGSDPHLELHVASCASCRELLDWNRAIFAAIPTNRPQVRLADAVIVQQAARKRWRNAACCSGVVVACAALLLALRTEAPAPGPEAGTSAAVPAEVASSDALPTDDLAIWSVLNQFAMEDSLMVTEPITGPIAGGIRPIRNSLGMAFGALRDTLPPGKQHRRRNPQACGYLSDLISV
jgi:hypothetical protein